MPRRWARSSAWGPSISRTDTAAASASLWHTRSITDAGVLLATQPSAGWKMTEFCIVKRASKGCPCPNIDANRLRNRWRSASGNRASWACSCCADIPGTSSPASCRGERSGTGTAWKLTDCRMGKPGGRRATVGAATPVAGGTVRVGSTDAVLWERAAPGPARLAGAGTTVALVAARRAAAAFSSAARMSSVP